MGRQPVTPEDAKTIAEFCRLVRESNHRTQQELADEFEIPFQNISKVERGLVEYPIAYLRRLKTYCTKKQWERATQLVFGED